MIVAVDQGLTTVLQKHRKIVHQLLGMHNSRIFMPYQEFETRAMLVNLLDKPDSFYHEVEQYSASVTFSLLCVYFLFLSFILQSFQSAVSFDLFLTMVTPDSGRGFQKRTIPSSG